MIKNTQSQNLNPEISIIIPTFNEESNIVDCLIHLKSKSLFIKEIIVADGGSLDKTTELAQQHGAKVINCKICSRAAQMNMAAELSTGNILYFVHADTKPPLSFPDDIVHALKMGYKLGGYRQKFDKNTFTLKYNAFFSRFNFLFCRGGDQSIFIDKKLFQSLGGYNTDYVIMEEYDLLRRARKNHKFYLFPKATLVSSRKYNNNTIFRVNWANAKAMIMFYYRIQPKKIKAMYQKSLKPY